MKKGKCYIFPQLNLISSFTHVIFGQACSPQLRNKYWQIVFLHGVGQLNSKSVLHS